MASASVTAPALRPFALRTFVRAGRAPFVTGALIAAVVGIGCSATRGNDSTAVLPSAVGGAPIGALRQELDDWAITGDSAPLVASTSGSPPHADIGTRPISDEHGVVRDDASDTTGALHRVTVDAAQVPLDALLFLLAREAMLQLEPHALFDAPVTYRGADRALGEVLDELGAQVPFAWRIADGRLIVRPPAVYADSYPVDYLNISRSTRGRVGLATRVGTLSGGESGGGIANSSDTLIESVSEHRFWEALERDLLGLLDAPAGVRADGDPASLARGGISINRDAGLVSVRARPAVHRTVRQHLERLQRRARRQVLIEASVVEVSLSDRFEAGIDWQLLADGVNGISAAQILGGSPAVTATTIARLAAPTTLLGLVRETGVGSLSATVSLLETFGKVRILSRPRIIALNNQSSVLKVVDNRVYFTVNVERRFDDDREEIVTESEIHTVPVGLVMNVTPQIAANDDVMLAVRPTLSRILGFVDDPNPELALANVTNGVPEIQVRELESMLTVGSGEVAIIGGLMQDATRGEDRSVPGLSRLPLVGRLFAREARSRERSELLVLLRPTVLGS